MGMTSQSAHTDYARGQREAAGRVVDQIIIPSLFGGAPDPATLMSINRAQQMATQQVANQGLTGTGIAGRVTADVAKGGIYAQAQNKFDYINRLFSGMGSSSSGGSGPLGFTGFGGSGFGS